MTLKFLNFDWYLYKNYYTNIIILQIKYFHIWYETSKVLKITTKFKIYCNRSLTLSAKNHREYFAWSRDRKNSLKRSYSNACKYLRWWMTRGNLDRENVFPVRQCWFVRGEEPKDALSPITYASTMLFEGFPQAHAWIHSAMHWCCSQRML